MCLRFVFLLITRVVAWLRLWLNWADRPLLAILLGVIPRARRHGLRLLVAPDTTVRWHRDIVRRRWAARSTLGRPAGRHPTDIKTLVLRLAPRTPDGDTAGSTANWPAWE
jgi:putative transposase